MLTERHFEKLRSRFPYLFDADLERDIRSEVPTVAAAASQRVVESLTRFLSSLFLAEVLRRGPGDDRVVHFLNSDLEEPSLARWIAFQRLLVEERRVPFEGVFSLDFKRRDLLQLLNKRYLDYLEQLQDLVTVGAHGETEEADRGSVSSSPSSGGRGLHDEFIEFLLTYFKSELVEDESDAATGLRLVNRDREQGFRLEPLVRGSLDDIEIFTGFTADGISFHSLATSERRDINDPDLMFQFGELLLGAGAYAQAMKIYERMARGESGPQEESAAYARFCYRGTDAYRRGKYHQAILEFEKAIAIRGDLPALQYNMGLTYARLSNYGRAIQLLVKLVEENPALDRCYELLGDLFRMKGDPGSARRMYDKAFAANPYNTSVERKRKRLEAKAAAKESKRPAAGRAKPVAAAAEAAGDPMSELLVDLTAEAEAGRLRPVVGREAEIQSTIEILCCQMRSNPLLLGEPGVGKTAIIEDLAIRFHQGRVPKQLKGHKLYLMSVASLLAGAKFRGQFEERVLQLVQTLKSEPCVLFIDDIHTIVNSGMSKGGTLDTSSLLKPALVRGEIQVIGATNYDEYRLNLEKDPSLSRTFQLVDVAEPTVEEMCGILAVHTDRLAAHHGVVFEDIDFAEMSQLIRIHLRERRLPDVAINVFDRAAARVGLASTDGDEPAVVSREDVAEVLSEICGVPVTRLTETETDRYLQMEEILAERVIGQPEAVAAVAQVMRTSKLNLDVVEGRPNGVFLFAGPSGVGKTELARALADLLFGDEEKLIRIDMSEYMEKIASSRLIGTAPGYVGYNDQNQLTDQVRKNPYSVILLDEIEKADAQMLSLFLQVFDAGRLTDGKGRTVFFDNTTIVLTSNLGTELFSQTKAGYADEGQAGGVTHSQLMKEVKRFFPPEFLNRIDEVVFFNQLRGSDIEKIARLQLKGLSERLAGQGVELVIAREVFNLVVEEGYSAEFGARNLSRTIRRKILDPLAAMALGSEWERVTRVLVTADGGTVEISFVFDGDASPEPAELPTARESGLEAAD